MVFGRSFRQPRFLAAESGAFHAVALDEFERAIDIFFVLRDRDADALFAFGEHGFQLTIKRFRQGEVFHTHYLFKSQTMGRTPRRIKKYVNSMGWMHSK